MGKRFAIVLIGSAAVACLLAPSIASASTVEEPGIPQFNAGDGEVNHVTITGVGDDLVITDTAGVTTTSCTQDNPNQVTCTAPTNDNSHIAVNLGDLDDELTFVSPNPQKAPLIVAGGAGNDRIDLSDLAPIDSDLAGLITADVHGDAGDDTMIGPQIANPTCVGYTRCIAITTYGSPGLAFNEPPGPDEPGDDTMIGGPGNDHMGGGSGSDFIEGRNGADILDGQRGHSNADNAVDTMLCGAHHTPPPWPDGDDSAGAGAGDIIGIDCEEVDQEVLCPPGATCAGTPLISTTTTAPAPAGSVATSARKRRRKVVLGRAAEKIRLRGGKSTGVLIELRKRRVRGALGKRRGMTVTFSQNFDRLKKGRKVGEANRRKRFKMRRR